MGTTVTMAFHLGRQVCIVHVGDSRAYLHRDEALHQLTEDHTLTAEMRRSGSLGPDQVLPEPFRHVITNVVGGNELGSRSRRGHSRCILAIGSCSAPTA